MKIWAIAANTFGGFLRDRLLIVVCVVFACIVLLMMSPLLAFKAITTAANASQMHALVLSDVAQIMSFLSGAGSLLAALAAAHAVAAEMKSGTIQAVMARPLNRWQFLAGKFFSVMLLMLCYVVLMLGLSYLLSWMGGERIQSAPWLLIAYPLARYAIYAALAILLVTFMHTAFAFAIVVVIAVLATLLAPGGLVLSHVPAWIHTSLYTLLPSTGLLSETRFLTITSASLRSVGWLDHLTTLAYGFDYAFVCLLLAMWSFHYRALRRD